MKSKEGEGTKLYIQAGWLIDGTGGPALQDVLMEISNGIILSIKTEGYRVRACEDVIDFSQCTILPGLVDSHVHLAMSGSLDPEIRKSQLNASFEEIRDMITGHLNEQLCHGVVALRDGGDRAGHTLRYKKECLEKCKTPVFFGTAGRAWHAEGRYGGLIGRSPIKGMGLTRSILMEDLAAVDHIKIVNSGLNSLSRFGLETPPQFDTEELREAVMKAEEQGLKTMIHANGKRAVRSALEAGCHSIEHGFFMGDDNLALMAEKGVTWVPTLFTMKAYSLISSTGSTESRVALNNLRHQIDQVSRAESYGVNIAAGTDAGSPGVRHGNAISKEIGLLIAAGLSLEKGISCASLNGASLLGIADQAGRLTPGMPGTFVLAMGGPDRILDQLDPPLDVWINGISATGQPALKGLMGE